MTENLPDIAFSDDVPMQNLNSNEKVEIPSNGPVMFCANGSRMLDRSHSPKVEEHTVITNLNCSVKVFVQPAKGKTPIVTFHDIGTNHNSFLGFFNNREMRVLMQHFTIYHICAPGHEENALTLGDDPLLHEKKRHHLVNGSTLDDSVLNTAKRSQVTEEQNQLLQQNGGGAVQAALNGRQDRSASLGFAHQQAQPAYSNAKGFVYPTMDQLAEVVHSVATHFSLRYFIGFGMGAGSNVLCRYAMRNQDNVRALFLLNPDASVHGYYQWFKLRWSDLPQLQRGVYTDNLLNQLEWHWFGYGMSDNLDLVQFYEQMLKSLNPINVAGYIDAFLNRTDLGLKRNLAPENARGDVSNSTIKADVCLVTGDRSKDLARTLADMNGRMDPAKTQYLILEDCNGMLMEENPDTLAVNLLYFLRTNGLLINMTPEMLAKEVERLVSEELREDPVKELIFEAEN